MKTLTRKFNSFNFLNARKSLIEISTIQLDLINEYGQDVKLIKKYQALEFEKNVLKYLIAEHQKLRLN